LSKKNIKKQGRSTMFSCCHFVSQIKSPSPRVCMCAGVCVWCWCVCVVVVYTKLSGSNTNPKLFLFKFISKEKHRPFILCILYYIPLTIFHSITPDPTDWFHSITYGSATHLIIIRLPSFFYLNL